MHHQVSPQQWSVSPPADSAGNWELGTTGVSVPSFYFLTQRKQLRGEKGKEAEFTGAQSYPFAGAHLGWEPGWVDGRGLHPLRSEAPMHYAEF